VCVYKCVYMYTHASVCEHLHVRVLVRICICVSAFLYVSMIGFTCWHQRFKTCQELTPNVCPTKQQADNKFLAQKLCSKKYKALDRG
jgi:hypothetical protein